ncbi:hypothetical protein AUC71_06915 [Methyloceanibacter marginalis]|uniref:Uncharacterized protein n=1 Tax=Methyloceanibacter marginalis TaxID=1774971 RepID=A0A1E3WDU7_9HYPH|nr:hypothetical protein [Methyloceanibacter marginalis]ODS03946.1 hypothetical protein AUC71_06915 [Methyloceanibacter marginalis]
MILASRGARAHDVGHEAQQAWIGCEQREELKPRRHAGDHLVECGERQIRLRCAAESFEQMRQERGQSFARLALRVAA